MGTFGQIMIIRRSLFPIFVFATLAACLSAQTVYLTKQPGAWKPWKLTAIASARAERGVLPAELKAFEAKLIELSEFLRRTPGIGQPIGFSVETWGNLAGYRPVPGQPLGKQLPLSGATTFGAFPIFEYQRNGKTIREDTGETNLLQFVVNDLQSIYRSRPVEWEQIETDAVLMPAVQGTVAGYPLVLGNVIVKKNAKPLTVPFSLEQALKLVLPNRQQAFEMARDNLAKEQASFAEWQTPAKRAERKKGYQEASVSMKDGGAFAKQMEGQESQIEAVMRASVAPAGPLAKSALEAEAALKEVQTLLAALSPAEGTGPSCYNVNGKSLRERFRPVGATGCVPLVRPNWNYFDARLPRSAPQLIVISGYGECLKASEDAPGKTWGCVANRKLVEGLDWAAVVGWLDH